MILTDNVCLELKNVKISSFEITCVAMNVMSDRLRPLSVKSQNVLNVVNRLRILYPTL